MHTSPWKTYQNKNGRENEKNIEKQGSSEDEAWKHWMLGKTADLLEYSLFIVQCSGGEKHA